MTRGAPAGLRLVDPLGRPVRLGRELGRGGEGAVFEVEGAPQTVAKLYHAAASPIKAAKLAAMARLATSALTDVAAWPTATLQTAPGAPVLGLLMPRVTGYAEVHHLYSPAERKQSAAFRDRDYAFLVHVARNLASAVERIHEGGHVIGDVNQGNAVVSREGTVKLIDCDSFQISDGGRCFPCEVGVAHFTPPELQGRSFHGVVRTQNHDAFGLSVLLFHLLFMGRHPFAGRYAGRGDMPLEQAIAEFRFAFGHGAGALGMAPPPHALALGSASPDVAALFERAYSRDGTRDGARPTAAQWKAALTTLAQDLRPCAAFAGHKYHRNLPECPWCAIERAGGPDLFISVNAAVRAATGFDLEALWAELQRLPALNPAEPVPTPPTTAPPTPLRLPARSRQLYHTSTACLWAAGIVLLAWALGVPIVGGLVLALSLGGVAYLLRHASGLTSEAPRLREEARKADAAIRDIESRWRRAATEVAAQAETRRRALATHRTELLSVPESRRRALQVLESQRRNHQRQQFLERFFIRTATVSGIGPGLAATLASYGIETAADVNYSAVIRVPGFGPSRTSNLVAWRQAIEARFVFNPAQAVDPVAVAAIDRKFSLQRQELETAISVGAAELRQIHTHAVQARAALAVELGQARTRRVHAKARLASPLVPRSTPVGRIAPAQSLRRRYAPLFAVVGGVMVHQVVEAARTPTVATQPAAGAAKTPAPVAPAAGAAKTPASVAPAAPRSRTPDAPAVATTTGLTSYDSILVGSLAHTRSTSSGKADPAPENADQPYFEFQVDKQAQQIPGTAELVYPDQLRSANVEGEVLTQFVVDTTGHAEMGTFKVLKSSHELFTQAVRNALPNMRFYPAEIGGRKVKQMVQQPFTFSLTAH